MTRVLVTRPRPDGDDTARRLAAFGLSPTVCPLMHMRVTKARLPDAGDLSGLIVTSANAIRALLHRGALDPYLGLPLYAVGEKTALVANEAGFVRVESAGGDADALIDLVGLGAEAGRYFYPSAKQTARDLSRALSASGLSVIAAEVYAMQAVRRLPKDIVAELAEGAFSAVLVYSRRSATLFAELAAPVLTPERRRALGFVCLSENVAEPLVAYGFPRIVLTDFPSEEAMMAATLSFSRSQITS